MLPCCGRLPLHAQETELRGEVSESAILSDQQRRARQLSMASPGKQRLPTPPQASRRPAYVPASPGALPDDTDAAQAGAGSIFDPPRPPTIRSPTSRHRPSHAGRRPQDNAPPMRTRPRTKPRLPTRRSLGRPRTRPPPDHGRTETDDTDQDTANRRAVTIDSVDRQKLDPGAERTEAIEGLRQKAEDNPYAATGIRSAPSS